MSNRRVLNILLSVTGALLLATVGFIAASGRQGSAGSAQLEAAEHQQALLASLVANADSLVAGTTREQALAARADLGRTIVGFDQGLGALLRGGLVTIDTEPARRVRKVGDRAAREALEQASRTWIQTGVPLGDLATGQYSPFSAAGQQALAGLRANGPEMAQRFADAAQQIRHAAAVRSERSGQVRRASLALGVVWLGLLACRLWPARRPVRRAPDQTSGAREATAAGPARDSAASAGPAPRPGRGARTTSVAPAIDFKSVHAAVDQMTVDMGTIAGRSDRMRQAIDTVGNGLQGLLDALNEMARDTTEGLKIVRNANNAATFTANAAGELLESAREMSRIVARVAELADRTRHVAAQIEEEAVHTGRTGEALTAVVAHEVKGLAQQTNRATWEIDQTVGNVLATARQFEEAIGQIIANVTAINTVSQNLGRLMLDPPAHVESSGPSPAPAPVDSAAEPAPSTPAAEPLAGLDDDAATPEPTTDDVAATTGDAIAEVAVEATTEPVAPAPPAPEPAETRNNSVFLLGKPRRKPTVSEVLGGEPPAPTADVRAPEAAPAEAPVPEAEPLAATEPAPDTRGPDEDPAGAAPGSVFVLNRPRTARGAETSAPETAEAPAEQPVVESAAAPEPEPGEAPAGNPFTSPNIFMLNRPKKKAAPADAGNAGPATAVAEPEAGSQDTDPSPWGD